MPAALLTVLTILGWLTIIIGAVLLTYEGITHRVLSRPGTAAIVVGVLLLVLAYALAPTAISAPDYDALALALLT